MGDRDGPPSGGAAVAEVSDRAAAIVQAVRHTLNTFGIRRATVADTAREVGVSRQTVYEYFPTREALIQAALESGARELVADSIAAGDRAGGTPAHRLAAAVSFTLSFFRSSPLWATPAKREELLVHVTVEGGVFLATTSDSLRVGLEAWWPGADPRRVARMADTLARTLISHGLAPRGDDGVVAVELSLLVDDALGRGG